MKPSSVLSQLEQVVLPSVTLLVSLVRDVVVVGAIRT